LGVRSVFFLIGAVLVSAGGLSALGPGWPFLAGFGAGIALAFAAAAVFLLRPLLRARNLAGQIAAGDFAARFPSRPSGPAAALADSLNEMAEQVQRQMALASEGRSRLAAALNSSIDAVAALDAEGRILFANVAFEELFGRKLRDVEGRPFVWVLADQAVVDAVRASREQGTRQINAIERPGKRFLQVATTPIAGGGEWAVLVVFHDVTDVKRTEQVRRDFVANVSHELRTPLAALKSVVETLAEGALQDEAVASEFLRRADSEVDRLVQLVEELLELSRIESGEQPLVLKPADLPELLAEAVERLRPQAERGGLTLDADIPRDLGEAKIDGPRIERAVLNLLSNAIKFTPPGGRVTLRARREDGRLTVEVRDTGIGIAASDLPRVFERFYKADQARAGGGSGLGLALVKHAVEAHGGSVRVESEPEKGSVFSFTIPV